MDASEIPGAPRSIRDKGELFKVLLNEGDAEDALEGYEGPDSTSLMSLIHYKGDSSILQSLQQVAALVHSGLIIRQRELLSELDNVFSPLSVERLCDSTQHFSLRLPSLTGSRTSPGTSFTFVGRPELKILADEIQQLAESTGRIEFAGHPGRGKSCILAALAGLRIIQSSPPAVYILSELFVVEPLEHLRMALLLAFWKHPRQQVDILRCSSVEKLVDWCWWQTETLLFLIDEANSLDEDEPGSKEDRQLARKHLSIAASRHCTVWCGSPIEPTWWTDKVLENEARVELERPFNDEELTTWLTLIEQREKRQFASCRELLYYTGYIPRLLTEFARSSSVGGYCKDVMSKIFRDFRRRAEKLSRSDLITLEKMLAGGRVPRKTTDIDLAFFYVEELEEFSGEFEWRVWCTCSYLEQKARALVHSRLERTYCMELLDRFEDCSTAIHRDARRANPARMVWLVEGVVIDCLKALGRLGDYSFKHSSTFSVGSEAEALRGSKGRLREGILFVPVQFDDEAIDVVLVKLVEGVLNVRGVQFSITTWKRKEESHVVWLQELGLAWNLGPSTRVNHSSVSPT